MRKYGLGSTKINDQTKEATLRKRIQRAVKTEYCIKCGSTHKLERHHIDGNVRNSDLSNIAVLCGPCHRAEHGRYPQKDSPRECAGCGKIFTPGKRRAPVLCGDMQCKTEYMSRINKMEYTVDQRHPSRKWKYPSPEAPRKRMNGIDSNRTEPVKPESKRRQVRRKVKLIECVNCGSKENLHRQFIDGDKSNYEIENMIVLCKSCHLQRADK